MYVQDTYPLSFQSKSYGTLWCNADHKFDSVMVQSCALAFRFVGLSIKTSKQSIIVGFLNFFLKSAGIVFKSRSLFGHFISGLRCTYITSIHLLKYLEMVD